MRTIDDLSHAELAVLVREHLLAGHLIDRAGMPVVVAHGLDTMRDIAIQEWMGASPIYTKRMQRLLGFEGDTVETVFKGMQLDIGAPPEFMDFRYRVDDDHHGEFFLNHCGALMDVEPMGEDFVVAMCHDIEDPTFDATGWATNPRVRMHPTHRPPRVRTDRHPHCAWTVEISDESDALPMPGQTKRIGDTEAARLPLALIGSSDADDGAGRRDYAMPLDPDLRMEDFSAAALAAIDDEVCLQGHLLVMSFLTATEDRLGTDAARDAGVRQFAGVAGVAAARLRAAFGLGSTLADMATVFELHPAFRPRAYVAFEVALDGDAIVLHLGDGPALDETGVGSWAGLLAQSPRPLEAIAMAVDPRATCHSVGERQWRIEIGETARPEMDEVTLTRFSTGADFRFRTP